jgi:hypothetical protein
MFGRILARRSAVACYEEGKAALDRDDLNDCAQSCYTSPKRQRGPKHPSLALRAGRGLAASS